MPKRGCDVHNNEIARLFKLHSKGLCEVISFTVPRKVRKKINQSMESIFGFFELMFSFSLLV